MALGGNQFLSPQDVISISNLREGEVVADLGCGSGGFFALPFAQTVGPTGKVYAVDILPEAIQTVEAGAKRLNLTNVVTLRSNLEMSGITPIPHNSLDSAYLINVLFQNTEKEAIVREADSFVQRGGLIVVVDWRDNASGFGPKDELLVNRDQIAGYLEGYTRVASQDLGPYHFIDVYRKA